MSIMNRNGKNYREDAVVAHRQSLVKNLQHRLEVARSNGDERLINQLVAEAKYLKIDV